MLVCRHVIVDILPFHSYALILEQDTLYILQLAAETILCKFLVSCYAMGVIHTELIDTEMKRKTEAAEM